MATEPAFAQPAPLPLFTSPATTASAVALFDPAPASRYAITRRVVGLNLDRLFDPAITRVLINIDERGWIARLERLDSDAAAHRSWVGSIESIPESHVSVTERNGIVSGLINAQSALFEIRTIRTVVP
jgi:hypothetical protein